MAILWTALQNKAEKTQISCFRACSSNSLLFWIQSKSFKFRNVIWQAGVQILSPNKVPYHPKRKQKPYIGRLYCLTLRSLLFLNPSMHVNPRFVPIDWKFSLIKIKIVSLVQELWSELHSYFWWEAVFYSLISRLLQQL